LNSVKQNIYDPDNQFRPLKTPYRCWKFFGEQIKITALSGACFLVNSTHSDKDYYWIKTRRFHWLHPDPQPSNTFIKSTVA